jgi:glycosyltransferase involved in cell wall biosynthesis
MFWGRLAARWARVPVVVSALHSTGWPDGVGRLNRMLTRITDAFVGVAETHGRFLVEHEGFPPEKVHVIPNGVDTERFSPLIGQGDSLRSQLGLGPTTPVAGIVAALRPEKNHELFLASAKQVLRTIPEARFLIVGDGDLRGALEARAAELDVAHAVKFLGTRSDVPQVLGLLDVFLLTSHNEANPVSILEAMSMARPVIATRVGSVEQSVHHGETGYVVDPGDAGAVARHCVELLSKPLVARAMGAAGRRQVVEHGSLDAMVRGYEDLIERLFQDSAAAPRRPQPQEA